MRTAALLAACLLGASAWGQTPIYRCGPDGREFSQQPCKGGRAIDAGDPRSAAQRQAAQQVADDDARRAEALARERRAREREARPAAGFHTAPVPEQAKGAAGPRPLNKPTRKKRASSVRRP